MKVKIGTLTKIRTGKLDANASSKCGTYPFFTCSREPLKIDNYSYDCECVLVAGNGDLNVKYYNGKFDAYQRTYIIEDNGSGELYVPYLYYFLDNYIEELRRQAIGGVIKYIKLANLTEARIELPNKDKQKKIVIILDNVQSLIDKRKRQLEKLDELVKSRFIEMFGDPVYNPMGWETKGLLELGKCKNGMNFSAGESGVNVHCLGVGDFKDYSEINDTSILPKISLNKMPPEEVMLQDGDIVFVRSNGNKMLVGRCLVIFPGDVPTTYSGFCIRFRKENERVDTTYLIQLLKADSTRSKMAGRGANIQNLNQQILGALQIPIPPIELQEEFKEFIKQSDKSKFEIKQSLEKLELLKKALMQKYFG
mgnify:CR=1 FL=1